jgi:hypothetical protein
MKETYNAVCVTVSYVNHHRNPIEQMWGKGKKFDQLQTM